MNETCYLCEGEKHSKEHVPARCFFPKEDQYRKNLIKVSSCKKHNEDTSKDDEYVRNIICMSIGNNAVAYKQFIEEVLKSFQHSPALQNQTLQTKKQVYVKKCQNVKPTFAFSIDRDRFDKVMKKIGYALYYYKYGKVWQRELIVATEFLLDKYMHQDEFGELISSIKSELKIPEFDGENPQVFQYKFEETETEDVVILWMKFYEGFEVFIIPNTNTSNPCL